MRSLFGMNQPQENQFTSVDFEKIINMDLPEREFILSPWLSTQGIAMIYAPRGVGKTHVSLGIAYAVATGQSYLTWEAPRPTGVLFIDGEMQANLLKERLELIAASHTYRPESGKLRFITPDLQPIGMPDLASIEGQMAIDQHIDESIGLVIVDNLSTLMRSGKENEAESWLPVQNWALRHRAQGRTVLFIHHSGKGGQQRGTSRREDVLDAVIALKHPIGYTADQGACFEVHFEKSRGIFGDDVAPFIAKLITDEENQRWDVDYLDNSNYEKTVSLLKDGISQADIAKELDLNKSTISRYSKKAKESGRV